MVPVPAQIEGTAFFPGGYGLWRPDPDQPLPEFPIGGVMILGHDFHSEVEYRQSLQRRRERTKQPTWRNLLPLLNEAEIALDRCFFTNFFMGLRAGKATTGQFPGAKDPDFVAHCQRFFIEQLATQRPSIVLVLGVQVPPLIGVLARKLHSWAEGKGLAHVDAVGPVQIGVEFDGLATHAPTVVALTHPSKRPANVGQRNYRGATGHAAEVSMIADAVRSARVYASAGSIE